MPNTKGQPGQPEMKLVKVLKKAGPGNSAKSVALRIAVSKDAVADSSSAGKPTSVELKPVPKAKPATTTTKPKSAPKTTLTSKATTLNPAEKPSNQTKNKDKSEVEDIPTLPKPRPKGTSKLEALPNTPTHPTIPTTRKPSPTEKKLEGGNLDELERLLNGLSLFEDKEPGTPGPTSAKAKKARAAAAGKKKIASWATTGNAGSKAKKVVEVHSDSESDVDDNILGEEKEPKPGNAAYPPRTRLGNLNVMIVPKLSRKAALEGDEIVDIDEE